MSRARNVCGPWYCPHCGNEITPISDPDEYEWSFGEGRLTAACWNCGKPVTVVCRAIYEYEVEEDCE